MSGKRKREGGQTREARRLAKLLEDVISETGASQSELGRRLGVHPSYVNKWISGEREGVGAEIIGRACEEFSVDPWYFFEQYKGDRSYREYPLKRTGELRALADKIAKIERRLADEDSKVTRRRS